jgi:D-alanine--poly(phosphoribitol) ligase subunit 1
MLRHHYNLSLKLIEIAAENKSIPALRYPHRTISYGHLDEISQQLAVSLLRSGLRQGDVIAIGHNKQPLSYALMLAALRLGIPYVNIDVASPVTRNLRILETSRASVLFFDDSAYQESMQLLSTSFSCPLQFLDETNLIALTEQDRVLLSDLACKIDGACIAYIMFTSGSTGTPKGVAVTHQNVLHLIEWGQKRFAITNESNFANLSPMYFDNSVFDFYVGLFSGASLTPIPRNILSKPYELVEFVGRMKCTIWFSVPSMLMYLMTMKALAAQTLPTLREIVFGGEGYPKPELRKLYTMFAKQANLVNVYGPTECTCICSAHTLSDEDFDDMQGLPTLGHLNQNFDYQILDDDGKDSATGELCLIGPNVASGYFNDPERTAASFLTLTELRRFQKRMYRTGDLVREEDGKLYFIGRKDNQIKHMGYRIELEEIEHALMRISNVDQAAVIYQRTRTTHGKLVGFVASLGNIDGIGILSELKKLLPDYMVPSQIIVLEKLPKNQNGKVDKHQLYATLPE